MGKKRIGPHGRTQVPLEEDRESIKHLRRGGKEEAVFWGFKNRRKRHASGWGKGAACTQTHLFAWDGRGGEGDLQSEKVSARSKSRTLDHRIYKKAIRSKGGSRGFLIYRKAGPPSLTQVGGVIT